MASIPSNGYREVMVGTNNYTGSNSYDADCPKTAIVPVDGDDLCNKTYVDAAGGGLIGLLTDKGSLITANGTNAVIFDQNPYQTALTTTTVYDWNSLAIAQSRNFTTTSPTVIPLGATITITYSGTDSIKGTITAIAGTTITLTITALASATYTSAILLTTTAPDNSYVAGANFTGQTYIFNPTVSTPPTADIPPFSMITNGTCNVVQSGAGAGNFTFGLLGTGVQRGTSNIAALPVAIPFVATPTALTWSGTNGGCFYNSATSQVPNTVIDLIVPSPPFSCNFNAPIGGGFSPPEYCGYLSGYALSYGTGAITIDDDIALVADPASATGLSWGVINTGSIGAVNSVVGGTNIIMSGTLSTPVVNLRNPLTAELNVGTQLIRDRNGSSGSSGQVLTAGTGSQVLWGNNGVSSVTATPLANITIGGTSTAPTVGVSNPCNATLALGSQNLTAVSGFESSTFNYNGMDTNYFQAGVAGANADLNTNLGNAQLFLSSSDLAVGGTSHLLQMVCPLTIGNADLLHTTVGATKRNMDIATEGSLGISAGIITLPTPAGSNTGITLNAGGLASNSLPVKITNSNVGGQANPTLTLTNTNATGSVAMEVYKNKPTAGVNGDVLFNQSVYGKDSTNAKQEYTRISHTIRDSLGGTEDGSIELSAFRAGAVNTFLQINGVDNEVNCLKNLDMGGNNINTNTGNLTVDGTTSTGNGTIFLNPKTGANGYVAINTAGGSNLRLDGTINNLTAPTKNSIDMATSALPVNGFTINRNLVKLDYQQLLTNDVSIIQLDNDPTTVANNIEASYLQPATGELAQSILTTTPLNHSLQLLNPTQGKSTKVFTGKVELEVAGNDITLDAGAFASGVQMFGTGTDAISTGTFLCSSTATTQEFRLQNTDTATADTKTLLLDNNLAGNSVISYENNTGDGSELEITSNTDISIGTIGGTGNSVFINALNETTVSSGNQLSVKVFNPNQPITLEVSPTGGFLNFVSAALEASTASAASGQFLCITLNGVQYKIQLLNP